MAECETSSSLASHSDKESSELLRLQNQLESLQVSHSNLQDKFSKVLEERDALRNREHDLFDEKIEKVSSCDENLVGIESVKECLVRVIESIGGESEVGEGTETGLDEELKAIFKLASVVELKINEYKSEKIKAFSENTAKIESVKGCLTRIIERIGGESNGEMNGDDLENEVIEKIGDFFSVGMEEVSKLAITAETKVSESIGAMEKENCEKIRVSSENLDEIKLIKERLKRVIESIGEGKNEDTIDENEIIGEIGDLSLEVKEVLKLVNTIKKKVIDYKEAREEEKSEKVKLMEDQFQKIKLAKEGLFRLLKSIDEESKLESVSNQNDEAKEDIETKFGEECNAISNMASSMEMKLGEYREIMEKEKRELESSVLSLTEENRDINTLLRVALAEKEAVERSLNKLKGNNEPKRGAIWGLPRVGFGFMMGTSEQVSDSSSAKSDSSESEEEVVTLASTVERMMKNLRLEINQLRRSLEESRSDTERLQSLSERQANIISENEMYIKELEAREAMLAQNVEELLVEIKETQEEVARWRKACELEVEAAQNVAEEQNKLVFILKQELEKTKAALEIANGKLKLKDDLANAAMAAQAAGERSLQLTDSRVSALNARVEELTKQLEEVENKDKIRRKVRRICWPFRVLKANSRDGGARNSKRMLPEMQALLN